MQVAQAFRDRLKAALDVARVALLFNGDPALIAAFVEKGAYRRIINGAAAERTHPSAQAEKKSMPREITRLNTCGSTSLKCR